MLAPIGSLKVVEQPAADNSGQSLLSTLEQTWREYVPERLEGFDLKMYLRSKVQDKAINFDGVCLDFVSENNYCDDAYMMSVGIVGTKEPVTVLARSIRQKRGYNVFQEKDKGIFFRVSDINVREAEGNLARVFAKV